MSVPVANPMMMKPAAAAAAAGDVVTKSLRFNDADTPSLSRTYTSSATWTFSVWVKRGELGATNNLLGTVVQFNASDQLVTPSLTTTAVYRDTASWYHICVSNSGLYVNGVQVTGTVSTSALSSAKVGDTFDGYLADCYFIDGTALTPTNFAEEDATTGQWKPKAFSGTYGTNGFRLDFEEDSATSGSNAGIGKDVSGNGNYFDTTNLAASDVVLDNPSAGSNFCTLNPLDISQGTLSEGNTKYTASTDAWGTLRSTFAASTGKWYWEVTATTVSEAQAWTAGILEAGQTISNTYWHSTGWNCYGVMDGSYKVTGSGSATFTSGVSTGSVIGFRLDLDSITSTIAISVDGVDKGTMFSSLTATEYSPALNLYGDAGAVGVADMNFGQGDPNGNNNYQDGNGKGNFKYEPPSGYLAWCTNSLTATIAKPSEHFNTLTYASSGAKTGVGFQPDLVWVKARGNTYDHELTDSVRGVQKALSSNDTGVESTDSTGLTVFGTDGFTVGAGLNYATSSMVAWNWKESAAAGMDIVTWTGNDSGGFSPAPQSVTHSLNVAPELIIAKPRTANGMGAGGWVVWTKDLSSGTYLIMNTTAGEASWSDALVSSIDDSSVSFGSDTMGNGEDLNADSFGGADTYVGYLFATVAGHSKVGLYNGNSSDNFVSLDFAPAWILIKSTGNPSSSGHWIIKDNKRSAAYNPADGNLYANDTYAEDTTASVDIDLLSNGFNIQGTYAGINATGSSYIFLAMAEKPQKYASAR